MAAAARKSSKQRKGNGGVEEKTWEKLEQIKFLNFCENSPSVSLRQSPISVRKFCANCVKLFHDGGKIQ